MISQRGASCVVSSTAAFTSMASNWPSAASGLANDWNLALRWASSYSSPGNSFCTDASTPGSAGTLGSWAHKRSRAARLRARSSRYRM